MFFVDLPKREERKEIIEFYLSKYLAIRVSDAFMNKLLDITDEFSGADIESSIRNIAYMLVSDNITLTEDIIVSKLLSVIPISKSNPDIIKKIRDWGKDKTISAS